MKRTWKVAGFMALACAVTVLAAEISIDYKRDADFSKYKTFAWQEGKPAANPTMHQRILEKLEAALTAAGYKRVDSLEKADLHVLYRVEITKGAQTEVVRKETTITGVPKWDYSSFVREGATVNQKDLTEGSLEVDIEEGATSTLLWSGVASGYLLSDDFEQNQKKAEQAIRLMFKDFPPKPAKPAAKPTAK
jgi:hypothetical protein